MFAAIALLVNALVLLSPASGKIRTALFFDCAITVPLCYWLLLVRPGLRGKASLALVAAVSVMRGAYMLPNGRVGILVGIVAEVALVMFVITRVKSIEDLLPSATLARIARAEIDVYRYAFIRPHATLPEGARAFTIHESSGAATLFWMLALLTPVEAVGLHFLLPIKLAWILTALSIYSAIWLIAVARSFSALPIVVNQQGISLRRGMMASMYVPREAIEGVSRQSAEKGLARFSVLSEPTVFLTFNRPLQVELPMGFTREVRGASIAPDDLHGFLDAINEN